MSLDGYGDVKNIQSADNSVTIIRYGKTFDLAVAGGGGVTDHGDLDGLADDDHTQYTLADGTRAFSGDQSMGGNALTNVTQINTTLSSGTNGLNIGGTSAISGTSSLSVMGDVLTGNDSVAIGPNADVTGNQCVALGHDSTCSANNSIAMLGTSSGYGCITMGDASIATTQYGIAIGELADSDGNSSIVIGANSDSTGTNCNVFGGGLTNSVAGSTKIISYHFQDGVTIQDNTGKFILTDGGGFNNVATNSVGVNVSSTAVGSCNKVHTLGKSITITRMTEGLVCGHNIGHNQTIGNDSGNCVVLGTNIDFAQNTCGSDNTVVGNNMTVDHEIVESVVLGSGFTTNASIDNKFSVWTPSSGEIMNVGLGIQRYVLTADTSGRYVGKRHTQQLNDITISSSLTATSANITLTPAQMNGYAAFVINTSGNLILADAADIISDLGLEVRDSFDMILVNRSGRTVTMVYGANSGYMQSTGGTTTSEYNTINDNTQRHFKGVRLDSTTIGYLVLSSGTRP